LGKTSVPSITLEHISVLFAVSCRVTRNDGSVEDGLFTVVRCTGRDKLLHLYFLQTVRVLFELLPEFPTKEQIEKAIQTMIELFRTLSSPPRSSVQGLWAELLIIDNARYPETLIAAWHSTPFDRYDFNAGSERLEVKSTSKHTRQHHFSLEQVSLVEGTRVLIASLFTEVVQNGVTVIQLANNVRAKIASSSALVAHLDRIIATTLGNNWQSAFEEAFDRHLALSTLRFYDAFAIPAIREPLPSGVSEVRFVSDLSNCQPVGTVPITPNGLFSALGKV